MKKRKLVDAFGLQKWGYLRESAAKAKKAGADGLTGLHRTGLEEYLAVIFPDVHDWVFNREIDKANVKDAGYKRWRPDYRSEALRLVVEFDGLQHYTSQAVIEHDGEKDAWYRQLGYRVVRIPYFIQLTNTAVKKLFGVSVKENLFDERFPSLGSRGSFPPNLCCGGIRRMAKEFAQFPEQYAVNIKSLKSHRGQIQERVKMLEQEYNREVTEKNALVISGKQVVRSKGGRHVQ